MTGQPGWEEIISRVTISSNHTQVDASAHHWTVTLQRARAVADSVRELARRTGESWTGPGARAFYEHLEKLAGALDQVKDRHEGIGPALGDCARELRNVVGSIPYPQWMEEEIRSKQGMYSTNGGRHDIAPGRIRQYLDELNPQATQANQDYVDRHTATAQSAYQTLRDRYAGALARIPLGTRVSVPLVRPGAAGPQSRAPGSPTSTLPAGTGMPMTGMPMTGMPMTGMPATGLPTNAGLPSTELPATELPSTELPESDVAARTDAGSGLAGLGPLGTKTGGIGGPGGIALPDIGPSAPPPTTAAGQAAAGGQALTGAPSRLATAAGGITTGPAATAMGMTPMGYGGTSNPAGETGTQLFEDDKQIFGPGDQDLPSGVLD